MKYTQYSPVLTSIVKEWLRLHLKPSKASKQVEILSIKTAFKAHTKLYIPYDLLAEILHDEGYVMSQGAVKANLKRVKLELDSWSTYRQIAPIYSEWVLDVPMGYWVPELYEQPLVSR